MKVLEGTITAFLLILFVSGQVMRLDKAHPHIVRGDVYVGEKFISDEDLKNPFLTNDTVIILDIVDGYCLFDHDCIEMSCSHSLSKAEFILNYTKVE